MRSSPPNLQGLPPVFSSLGLLRDEKGKTVFRTESGTLKEVLDRIDELANYGDTASRRYLADEFAKEPFGWDFEVVGPHRSRLDRCSPGRSRLVSVRYHARENSMPWARRRAVARTLQRRSRDVAFAESVSENWTKSLPPPFGTAWRSVRKAAPDGSGAPRIKVFILSHVPERFESVPDWPEFERVLLPALPLAGDLATNWMGEGRAFLSDLDSEGAEYIGYMNARCPIKYGAGQNDPPFSWERFRARLGSLEPHIVLAPCFATRAPGKRRSKPGLWAAPRARGSSRPR